ncbi:ABC transporter ATP-binding protein [Sinomonas humi]|uniref:ABC transporter domain-containing protein n=1 Tax=Sinomonas humi TaxID=1338436 RepID=A0A0B2APQ4_9MICC|nr:ABC transporter ATP-binding protein [Sinomonas humi]KHL03833.1 hypothetical protein LK10_07965 [Sinomonas humi]
MAALDVDDLRISLQGRVLVDGVSFTIRDGRRTCLLGASGSGKSLIARAIVGQLPAGAVATGSIKVHGVEVLGVPTAKRLPVARPAMVFQDSAVALNPLVRVREQLAHPLRRHRSLARAEAHRAAAELGERVGLPAHLLEAFPQELSGGQRQRACIALALACEARLLVADEPTTALDVVTQAHVLDVLASETAAAERLSVLFITHDFAVAAAMCTDAIILDNGHVVESGPLREIFRRPQNGSTQALVRAARTASLESARRPGPPDVASKPTETTAAFFDVAGLSKSFPPRFRKARVQSADEPALERVGLHPTDLAIARSERVGIVGVSGSGKTTLLRIMLGLEHSDSGRVRCDEQTIRPANSGELRWYRRRVQYVPQDPANTLDPRMEVRDLVAEPLESLGYDGDREAAVVDALECVGLNRSHLARRRNELSGGQAQRVAIARAIVVRPDFLLADEPVSGLDLPTRERVVGLLTRLADERGMGLLIVSHDLSVVASLCHRTLVLHDGRVIEDRRTLDLLRNPRHARTRELLAAIPPLPF